MEKLAEPELGEDIPILYVEEDGETRVQLRKEASEKTIGEHESVGGEDSTEKMCAFVAN